MTEHVSEWLNAYLDGELGGLRLRQVEHHLTECAACRHELGELRGLSTLLQETPPAAKFTPTERFAANLAMRLPRQAEARPGRRASGIGWWLVPAGTLVAWVILQVFLSLNTVVSVAGQVGLLGEAAVWLQDAPQHSEWFTLSSGFFGADLNESGRMILQVLDQADVLSGDVVWQLALQALIGLAYCSWLAVWFVRRQRRPGNLPRLPSNG